MIPASELPPETLRENPTSDPATAPDVALIDELYRREVQKARAMRPEDKLFAGERLFEWACEIALAGIRNQFPGATEEECQRLLARRLALGRELEKL
jgi:hypothetical protein